MFYFFIDDLGICWRIHFFLNLAKNIGDIYEDRVSIGLSGFGFKIITDTSH